VARIERGIAETSHPLYLEAGVQGITVRDPTRVASAARMFDDLRDEALSRSRSLELIAEVEKP